MRELLSGHVERGALPGLVALVAHHDQVHVEVLGTLAFGDTEPMPRDAIFRIASLDEADHRRRHDDPRRRRRAPRRRSGRRPAARAGRPARAPQPSTPSSTTPFPRVVPITVEDLLTFRLGFGNVMAPPGTYPIQRAEEELQLGTLGPPWPPPPLSPDEWIERLGRLPLMHQPGAEWMYNTGAQVLGVLIERAAGMPFESFLQERLFGPLGMTDTAFSVPPGTASIGSRPRTRPTRSRACCGCSTASTTATGATRRGSPTEPAGSCRPSTTSGPSCRCSSHDGTHGDRRLLRAASVDAHDHGSPHPRAARRRRAVPRRRRLGIRHDRARGRRHEERARRLRLGRRHGNDVAVRPRP